LLCTKKLLCEFFFLINVEFLGEAQAHESVSYLEEKKNFRKNFWLFIIFFEFL